jgi:hypothetical protein
MSVKNQEDLPEYQHRPPKGHHGLYPLNGLEELHGKAAFDVDIVAIHGLNGDIQNTWTHKRGTFWLQDLLPVSMPGARVFSYGYPSDIVLSRSVARIGDFAIHLLNELKSIARAEVSIIICATLSPLVLISKGTFSTDNLCMPQPRWHCVQGSKSDPWTRVVLQLIGARQ